MKSAHPAMLDVETLLADCRVRGVRRSGPGGQHRNKVETGVVIVHVPTGISAEAGERRSREVNKSVAVHRLRLRLALEVRSTEPSDEPSERWRLRCPRGRVRVSPDHVDFPALLAETLDQLAGVGGNVRAAASQFACSPSQLIRFLRTDPRGLALVNSWRAERGERPLR